jgi:hypothetical protein
MWRLATKRSCSRSAFSHARTMVCANCIRSPNPNHTPIVLETQRTIEAVSRIESLRLIAGPTRMVRHVGVCRRARAACVGSCAHAAAERWHPAQSHRMAHGSREAACHGSLPARRYDRPQTLEAVERDLRIDEAIVARSRGRLRNGAANCLAIWGIPGFPLSWKRTNTRERT